VVVVVVGVGILVSVCVCLCLSILLVGVGLRFAVVVCGGSGWHLRVWVVRAVDSEGKVLERRCGDAVVCVDKSVEWWKKGEAGVGSELWLGALYRWSLSGWG
jgi:hypothetical protein